MNLKTTFLLIILLGAGVGGWYWFDREHHAVESSTPTAQFLAGGLDAKKISRIEVLRGKEPRFILERTGEEWSLPGKWPVREAELKEWLGTCTTLATRFAPLPIHNDEDLKKYGLDKNPLTIKITEGDKTHTLHLGEEPAESNRFTNATFLRLDDQPEVLRLGPGILNTLDRPQDYFLQRRIFKIERVARDEDAKDKIEQVVASEIDVQTPTSKLKLVEKKPDKDWLIEDAQKKTDKDWQLVSAKDRADPAKLKSILTAFPDLWAEKFVDTKDKKLADFGLDNPEYVFTVIRPDGAKLKLLIGKVAETKMRLIQPPAPPPQFGPPKKQPPQMVMDEYRFAKLQDNDQIFQLKAEKLGNIGVALDQVRDPQLARFKADDVKRLEIRHGDQDLVFVKDKDHWKFEKPTKEDAETKPIEDLLDKLSNLQARDKEILDNENLKTVGLEKPQAQIKITLEEGKDDKKKTRTITFDLGTKEKEKDKAYVRVENWPRVNQVSDDVWKLLQRPVLAYRNRRILDIAAADLSKIEIKRADESFTLEKQDTGWKLTAPVAADVHSGRMGTLTSDLGKLEGVEFISDHPKAEDLDKTYGLTKPKLSAKLYYKDAKKPPQTLVIGNARQGKQDYYARVDQGPVFAVKKELRDDLDRSSLTYRPLQLWQLAPDSVSEIAIRKDGPEYHLKKDGLRWKLTGPFDADLMGPEVEEATDALAQLRGERFEAHQTKDLVRYGLDKPALKIQVTAGTDKPRVLEVGKAVDNNASQRYARLAGQDAILVVGDKAIAPVNKDALDWLDKSLVSLNPRSIQRVQVQGATSYSLEPVKEQWQVVGSPAATFLAEESAALESLQPWARLRAEKYAAYGPKIDWKQYGLDKPSVTVRVTMKPHEEDKTKKTAEHVLELGKNATGDARFARLDKKDAVVVLDAGTVKELNHSYLDFVDPQVLQYDSDTLTGIQRQMPGADFEIVKQEDQWRMVKPVARDADNLTINDLLDKTFRLRAKRIAAYPVKDLQPFGLDKPAAVVTLVLDVAGTPKKHVIKVGGLAPDGAKKDSGERYALIDDRPTVAVLSADLSRHLVAPVLYFADRNLASFGGIDQAVLERGPRKLVFAKPENTWQVIEPIKSDAEDGALDDLIRAMQRLRADEIVAGPGADLKRYGLDTPLLRWRFKSGENEKLNLIVGARENDKPDARRYAKLAGKNEVFLLSSKLTAKVADEYRSRKPWPALDAAQVERLTVTNAERPYALTKNELGWSVAGDPGVIVNAKSVTDTLDALASLKALRYVADTKANLQLYGLAAPAWKIDVQTPMGKRELWLGRTEGGTKRFYATVPGSDAVFVIDEAESQRIARPLSAFTQK